MYAGEQIDLVINKIANSGEGVGRAVGGAIFVPSALFGEKVRVKITHIGRRKVSASLVDVLEASKDRVSAPCEVFGLCGGCQLMHAAYSHQLEIKRMILRDTLRTIAGLDVDDSIPIHPSPADFGYRNRGQYPVAQMDGRIITGFFAPRSHRVIPVDTCLIHDPMLDRAVGCVRGWAQRKGVDVYDEHLHRGFLRHVVVRVAGGKCNGVEAGGEKRPEKELLVSLVGTHDVKKDIKALVRSLRLQLPEVSGLMLNINPERTNVILGKRSRLLWGRDWIRERLDEVVFKLSLGSFFQVNTQQAQVLFARVMDFLGSSEGPVVDAYCGVGALGLLSAARGHEVVGIEVVHSAVEDARKAIAENRLTQVQIHHGSVEKVLPRLVKDGLKPACIVLDPPRKGCAMDVLKAVGQSGAPKVAYVSCHPGTLARDLVVLQEMGYRLEVLEGVDMFPQTAHLEVLAGLIRKSN